MGGENLNGTQALVSIYSLVHSIVQKLPKSIGHIPKKSLFSRQIYVNKGAVSAITALTNPNLLSCRRRDRAIEEFEEPRGHSACPSDNDPLART
jgi:hypothetical protein